MKTDDNKCRECETKLIGKNAIDVGYCVSCFNMMMADPDDEDDFKPTTQNTPMKTEENRYPKDR